MRRRLSGRQLLCPCIAHPQHLPLLLLLLFLHLLLWVPLLSCQDASLRVNGDQICFFLRSVSGDISHNGCEMDAHHNYVSL